LDVKPYNLNVLKSDLHETVASDESPDVAVWTPVSQKAVLQGTEIQNWRGLRIDIFIYPEWWTNLSC
jgi:hypothetical protein